MPTPSSALLYKTCQKIERSKHDKNGAYIYGKVGACNLESTRGGSGYVIKFEIYDSRKIDWTSSTRFMIGSLLCLSKDGTFNKPSIVIATVLGGVKVPKGDSVCCIFEFFA